jgi:hypothetical protein
MGPEPPRSGFFIRKLEMSKKAKQSVSDLDKAIELVTQSECVVVHPLALAATPYIQKLSELFESAGYRLDEAKIERRENGTATGRILLAVFPFHALEKKE